MDFTLLMAWLLAVAAGMVTGYGVGSHREQKKHSRTNQNEKDTGATAAELLAHRETLENLPEFSYAEEENRDD